MTEQVNMADFIAARSDQLNADDLLDGPVTIKITRVSGTGSSDQPVAVHYEGGEGRPLKPCKTVRRLMVAAWGPETKDYVGRRMTLYRDPSVSFGGMIVGGIRVSHMSHLAGEKTLALQVTKGRKAAFTILPLKDEPQQTAGSGEDEQALALKALTEAAENGLDALANVWKQKWLAPHRDALQMDLERLKAVAAKSAEGNAPASEATAQSSAEDTSTASGSTTSASGPTVTTAASPSSGTLADAIADTPAESKVAEIKAALEQADAETVEAVIAEANPHYDVMPDEQKMQLDVAFSQARARFETAGAK